MANKPTSDSDEDDAKLESCPICCEIYKQKDSSGRKLLIVGLPCQHTFCDRCLETYLTTTIDNNKIPDIECPDYACRELFPESLQDSLLQNNSNVNPRYWKMLRRLRNEHTLVCPHCDEGFDVPSNSSQDGEEKESTSKINDVTCLHCEKAFCKIHGAMHPNQSCVAYTASPRGRELELSEAALDVYTKKCTRCGARLQRSDGCDYVVCGNCRGDFCWRCNTHDYMEGDDRRRCSQCNSIEHNNARHTETRTFCKIVCACFLVVAFTIMWPIVALFVLVMTGCLGCCFCGCRVDPSKPRQPGRAVLSLIIVECLPIMCCLDAFYAKWKKRPEGFVVRTLPPSWSSFAEEIPFATVGGETLTNGTTGTTDRSADDSDSPPIPEV